MEVEVPVPATGRAVQQILAIISTFFEDQKVTFLALSSRKMVNGIRFLKEARKVINILASGKPSKLARMFSPD